MIEELKNTPNTMVAFKVNGMAKRKDFDDVVLPSVSELVKRTGRLNYLLIVNEPGDADAIASWLREAMAQLNNHRNWNRGGIVADSNHQWFQEESVKKTPGEFRAFTRTEIDRAIEWVGDQQGPGQTQVFAEEGQKED
jgi:hypothetical protein